MTDNVLHVFGAHDYMTQEQVLGLAADSKWTKLIVVGYTEASSGPDFEDLVMYSVGVNRKDAVWILLDALDASRGKLDK